MLPIGLQGSPCYPQSAQDAIHAEHNQASLQETQRGLATWLWLLAVLTEEREETAEAPCSIPRHSRAHALCFVDLWRGSQSSHLHCLLWHSTSNNPHLTDKIAVPWQGQKSSRRELRSSYGGNYRNELFIKMVIHSSRWKKIKTDFYWKVLRFQEQQSGLPTRITGPTLEKEKIWERQVERSDSK